MIVGGKIGVIMITYVFGLFITIIFAAFVVAIFDLLQESSQKHKEKAKIRDFKKFR